MLVDLHEVESFETKGLPGSRIQSFYAAAPC